MITQQFLSRIQGRIAFLWNKNFVKDVFTLQVGSFFAYGIGFLKSIAFARLLGLEGFGVYAVALSLIGTCKILTGFGQEQALLTYLAEEYRQENTNGMRAVIKYFCVLTFLAGLVLLAFLFLSPFIASYLYQENAVTIGQMSTLGFAALILGLPHPLVISLLQIVRKVRVMTMLENVNLLLQLVLSVLCILLGYGPFGVFMGLFLSNLIMTIAYAYQFLLLRRAYNLPGIRESVLSGDAILPYAKQGFWIAIDKNVVNVFPQALQFILSLFASPGVVGITQLAIKAADMPSGLLFAQTVRMAGSTLPQLATKSMDLLRKRCILLIKHTLLFHALLIFGAMITLPFFIIAAYGWEFSDVIVPMICILFIRLLQPFSVADTSLIRIFRKTHVTMLYNSIRIPAELTLYYLLLRNLPAIQPIYVFVLVIFIHQLGAPLLTFSYVFPKLLRFRLLPYRYG